MKKIIFAGLVYDLNLGDQAIYEATKYELSKIFDNNKEEFDYKIIDLYGRESATIEKECFVKNLINRVKGKIKGTINVNCERVRRKCKSLIDENIDAIIFVGGGLIKYKQQKEICNAIQVVIEYAQKFNIPVMLSGVGVEGYEDNELDCQKLKKSINSSCVKYITTRDDIDLLNNKYISNNKIITAKVCDSACIINKLYPSSKKEKTNVIGLGMIRHNLFVDYGIDFTDEQAIALYKDLYNRITESGYKCEFFTNGNIADQLFAERVVTELNLYKEDVLNERPKNMEELIKIITKFEAVIVARLHASIISYSYDIPSIGLVWNKKQKFFGNNIGYANRFIEYPNLNADNVIKELKLAIQTGYKAIDNDEYKNSNYNYLKRFIEEYVFGRNN
ncbi:MAG: polysaccharide pyruvyl transferase family protein [Clostridia bacterium]|nr:polysaccharide pyruvyl transferase family protein [Clostridia bacterium]